MAITHKKNDQLEKMMAGFAVVPDFDKPLAVSADGKTTSNQDTEPKAQKTL